MPLYICWQFLDTLDIPDSQYFTPNFVFLIIWPSSLYVSVVTYGLNL